MSALVETVHTAEAQLRRPRQFVRHAAEDLRRAFSQAGWLFLSEHRGHSRRSLLGHVWVVLPPLTATAAWVFLHRANAIAIAQTDIPYPLYVLAGTILWELFLDALNCPLAQMARSQHLLTRVRLPAETLLLSGLADVGFSFLMRLLVVLAAIAAYRLPPKPAMLLAPAAMVALAALGFAIGLLVAPVGVLYRDVTRALGIAAMLWFFFTPVVYPAPAAAGVGRVVFLNPVTPLLVTARELLTTGTLSTPGPFLAVCGGTAFLLLAAWVLWRLSLPHLVSRMPAR